MAFSATHDLLALDFDPRPQRGAIRWRDRSYLLWPALAYRVVAPEPRRRALDRLEQAVLSLCRAGSHAPTDLAGRLHLAEELVRFIRDDLGARGLLDPSGAVTERGLRLLREETEVVLDRMVTGYVFQDAHTGALWPRFVGVLTTCNLEYADGAPHLLLGTTGNPFRARAFVVDHPRGVQSAPSPSLVLRAVAAHLAADRRRRSDDPDPEMLPPPPPLAESRVAFVEDRPLSCYLASYVYLDEDELDWRVCDPFGLGDSPRFRERLEIQATRYPPLAQWLERVREPLGRHRAGERAAWHSEIRETAEQRLRLRLPGLPTRIADELRVLAECVEQARYAEDLELTRLTREAAIYVRATLEACLDVIGERHPLAEAWGPLFVDGVPVADQEFVAESIDAAARTVGLATPLPPSLQRVRPHEVRGACGSNGGWSLRPRIVATLLAARVDPHHPLRAAARRDPRIGEELDELAAWSARNLHHRRARAHDPQPLDELAERVYRVLERFAL